MKNPSEIARQHLERGPEAIAVAAMVEFRDEVIRRANEVFDGCSGDIRAGVLRLWTELGEIVILGEPVKGVKGGR